MRKKHSSQARKLLMGLSSGEYGGRSLQPAFRAAENSRFLEWNEALSITITVPYDIGILSAIFAAAMPQILSAADPPKYPLFPRRIPVFPVQICIYVSFIRISKLFHRYILDCFQIHCCFLLFLLLIAG